MFHFEEPLAAMYDPGNDRDEVPCAIIAYGGGQYMAVLEDGRTISATTVSFRILDPRVHDAIWRAVEYNGS